MKEAVFKRLDEVLKPGAILATNTSTLDVDKIASFTRRPQDVIGTHFFSPANVMKLLEIVCGKATAKDVLASAMALSKKIKKTGVVSGVCDGFIGNRMLDKYARQAQFLLEEGALPLVNEGALILEEGIAQRASDIDLVYLAGYGFRPFRGGPMFHADTVSLFNVVRAIERFAKNSYAEPEFWKPAPLLKTLAAEGKTFNAA